MPGRIGEAMKDGSGMQMGGAQAQHGVSSVTGDLYSAVELPVLGEDSVSFVS